MRSSPVALFFLVAFVYSLCFANVSVGEVLLRKKMTTHSRGWFRSIDLWVMGPARFRCATLLMLMGGAREYFSTLILSHFPNTSKFNTVIFSVLFSPFSFFICLLYAFRFLSGPYSLCHSQNINVTRSLVCSPHKSSTLSSRGWQSFPLDQELW